MRQVSCVGRICGSSLKQKLSFGGSLLLALLATPPCGHATAAFDTPSAVTASLSLHQINDRQTLGELLSTLCTSDRATVRMLLPRDDLISEPQRPCAELLPYDQVRRALALPAAHFSATDAQWLRQVYQLVQRDTSTYMSEWRPLEQPQAINFLSTAVAGYPYLTARIMAAAPAPLVGSGWGAFYSQMDETLRQSGDDEDARLLAYAMLRDDRNVEALMLINRQLENGDALALNLLPLLTLELPVDLDDEMADSSEPEVSYQVVAMLENYLYRHGYPASFCQWAAALDDGLLKQNVTMVLNNLGDSLPCR